MTNIARLVPVGEFEHGVPIPRRSRVGRAVLISSMKDGDSKWFTEQQAAKSFYNSLTSYLRNTKSKTVIRKMVYEGENGWMVWKDAR